MDLLWAMGTSNSWSDWMDLDLRDNNYVGSLQFWQYALCSGTIDGAIRMWDRKFSLLPDIVAVLNRIHKILSLTCLY